jgi:hypothetical protein
LESAIHAMQRNNGLMEKAISNVHRIELMENDWRNDLPNDPSLSSLLLQAKDNIAKNEVAVALAFEKGTVERYYESDFSESENLQTSVPSSRTLISPEPPSAPKRMTPIAERYGVYM